MSGPLPLELAAYLRPNGLVDCSGHPYQSLIPPAVRVETGGLALPRKPGGGLDAGAKTREFH